MRQLQAARGKNRGSKTSCFIAWRRQNPALLREICECKPPGTRQRMVFAHDGDDMVVKQFLYNHTFLGRGRRKHAAKKQIDATLLQVAVLCRREQRLSHVDDDTRVSSRN